MKLIRLTLLAFVLFPLGAGLYFMHLYGEEVSHLLGRLPPLRPRLRDYRRVIDAIQSGQLKSRSFVLRLPSAYGDITPRNQVLYERRRNGHLRVIFPTWYGRGGDLQGYLYSSTPLTTAEGHSICGVDSLTIEPIDSNWYRVIRRLD